MPTEEPLARVSRWGDVRALRPDTPGLTEVLEPPSKLVYTCRWENEPDAAETLVTVERH